MEIEDAFNRLLERVEELSADVQRYRMEAQEGSRRIAELAREAAMVPSLQQDTQRLERFIESTPAMREAFNEWRKAQTAPKKADSLDDIPF